MENWEIVHHIKKNLMWKFMTMPTHFQEFRIPFAWKSNMSHCLHQCKNNRTRGVSLFFPIRRQWHKCSILHREFYTRKQLRISIHTKILFKDNSYYCLHLNYMSCWKLLWINVWKAAEKDFERWSFEMKYDNSICDVWFRFCWNLSWNVTAQIYIQNNANWCDWTIIIAWRISGILSCIEYSRSYLICY